MPAQADKIQTILEPGNRIGRPDLDPNRERLARLIGRLIAWEWLYARSSEENPTPEDLELDP